MLSFITVVTSLSLECILKLINWVHSLTPYFLKLHYIICLCLDLTHGLFLSDFSTKIAYEFFVYHPSYMPCPFHTLIWWPWYLLKIINYPILYIFLQPQFLKVQTLSSAIHSQTLNLFFRQQPVFTPLKNKGVQL